MKNLSNVNKLIKNKKKTNTFRTEVIFINEMGVRSLNESVTNQTFSIFYNF